MANNTAKYGFRPYQTRGLHTLPLEVHPVLTAYQAQDDGSGFSVDLNIGDPVKPHASNGTMTLAITTEDVYGIVVGIKPYNSGGVKTPGSSLPGGTTWTTEDLRSEIVVCPASACLWEIDVDENTTATTAAAYRLLRNANVIHTCVGDTTSKEARPLIDISSVADTESLTWRLVGVSDTMNNKDLSGTRVKVIVRINSGSEPGTAATLEVGYS